MPKANLYPPGSAHANWLLLTFHPETNETRVITLAEALSLGTTTSMQDKGAVAGEVAFDLELYSDFKLSIATNITADFGTPETPSYVLIEVIHTVAGTTITGLPGSFEADFAWATGAGEITTLVGRYNGDYWLWQSSVYGVPPTGGGGGGAVVVDDEFAGTAGADLTVHTPSIGGALSKVWSTTGKAVTNGDSTAKEVVPHSTEVLYCYANTFSDADQRVTLWVKKGPLVVADGDYDVVEICLRVDLSIGNKTYYYIQLIDVGVTGGGWLGGLYKMVNGVNTQLGTSWDMNYVRDAANHTVVLDAVGSLITAKVDGATKVSVTDTTLTAGRNAIIGFYSVNPNAYQVIVDRFKAENYSSISAPTVIDDAFTGTAAADLTAHTPSIGGALTKAWSTTGVAVTNGDGTAKAAAPASTIGEYAYAAVFSGADQKITVRLKKSANVAAGQADVLEIYLRADTTTAGGTGYYIQLYDPGVPTGLLMTLNKKVNGTNTEIGAAISINTSVVDGAYHTISIEATGSTIKTFVDGTIGHNVTETTLTAGRKAVLGFYNTSLDSAQMIVDNFKAENL